MSVLLRKALEMGDQVIGHTGAKKPIFANKGADHPHYANYSAADHIVAANVHANRAKELNIASSRAGGSMTLKRQAAQSTHFATTHRQAGMGQGTRLAASMAVKEQGMQAADFYRDVLAKAKGGAGSKGGNVIGRTRSGRAIYGSSHAKYSQVREANLAGNRGPGNHKAVREGFQSYSRHDHADAANHHQSVAHEAHEKGNAKVSAKHFAIADAHQAIAHADE